MDYVRPEQVSVIDPIDPALGRVRLMLFNPFDISKWLAVGLCAWLAYLGKGGGSEFNYMFNDHHDKICRCGPNLAHIREVLLSNLPWLIIGVVILIPLCVIIGLVLCWLSSRGKFMFVHCVAGNKAEVALPWQKYSSQANSLFLFRIVFALHRDGGNRAAGGVHRGHMYNDAKHLDRRGVSIRRHICRPHHRNNHDSGNFGCQLHR